MHNFLISTALASASAPGARKPAVRVPKTAQAPAVAPTGNPAPSPADAVKIAELLASDFVFTHGDGWTTGDAPLTADTKASWLAYVVKQPPPYVHRELDHVQVHLHGDIATTVGRYLYWPQSNNPDTSTYGSSVSTRSRTECGSSCRTRR
jgi:hypothetical protein